MLFFWLLLRYLLYWSIYCLGFALLCCLCLLDLFAYFVVWFVYILWLDLIWNWLFGFVNFSNWWFLFCCFILLVWYCVNYCFVTLLVIVFILICCLFIFVGTMLAVWFGVVVGVCLCFCVYFNLSLFWVFGVCVLALFYVVIALCYFGCFDE